MKGKSFRIAGTLAVVASMGLAASPAMADRGWDGGYGGHGGYGHHGHRDHDDGFGTFLGIAALVGVAAVIASSAAKKKKAEQNRDYRDDRDGRDERGYRDDRYNDTQQEDVAVNDCALAARDEGSREGNYAEVRDITSSRPSRDGWEIEGTIDQRESYRGEGRTRSFTCTWRDGRVADVTLLRDSIALR
jgi:hypothetical protein